jgi:transposase
MKENIHEAMDKRIQAPEFDPNEQGAEFWYEAYRELRQCQEEMEKSVKKLQEELEELKEKLRKLCNQSSETSSNSPSSDKFKKKSKPKEFKEPAKGKKRGPKYGHEGKTRNGFGSVDHSVELTLEQCPVCGGEVEKVEEIGAKVHQVAELAQQLVEIWEYKRPFYECLECGWRGNAPLPLGIREDFSYGGMLSSLVGWLGYGGNLTWSKQRFLVSSILGIPLSQGSLCKMHQWFCQSLYPSYEKWWEMIQEPGIRCLDETSYRLNGMNYWMWVATSREVCVLFLAPSRSSEEVKSLLGENFKGILSSDCWSAYNPVSAVHKQKCLAHIERELKGMKKSLHQSNRLFAEKVLEVLYDARNAHRAFNRGEMEQFQLDGRRLLYEAQLHTVIQTPPPQGWAADALNLAHRFRRHWNEWFTFLSYPEVKPDNNDAERALRPVVIHRKVSGGARSHWGGQLVAMMFSFLETMRLQDKNPVQELFQCLSHVALPPPTLDAELIPLT